MAFPESSELSYEELCTLHGSANYSRRLIDGYATWIASAAKTPRATSSPTC
jgi:hypothetical protein